MFFCQITMELRDYIHLICSKLQKKHNTVYSANNSKSFKVKNPFYRVKTHKADIVFGHPILKDTIPLVINDYDKIDPEKYEIIVWHTMTGDYFFNKI